jgi:hypothetical protein
MRCAVGFSNSRGQAKLHDLREGALCSGHRTAASFYDNSIPADTDGELSGRMATAAILLYLTGLRQGCSTS